MTHHEALTILGLRDAILAALGALASDDLRAAQRLLRDALTGPPPALRAELSAARAVVGAAQAYARCVGPTLPDAAPGEDTAYRVLVATLTLSERTRARYGDDG